MWHTTYSPRNLTLCARAMNVHRLTNLRRFYVLIPRLTLPSGIQLPHICLSIVRQVSLNWLPFSFRLHTPCARYLITQTWLNRFSLNLRKCWYSNSFYFIYYVSYVIFQNLYSITYNNQNKLYCIYSDLFVHTFPKCIFCNTPLL